MQGYSIRIAEAIKSADGNLLGVQLGRLCLERDIPVAEIAHALKVTRQTIYGWFSGTTSPRPSHESEIKAWIDNIHNRT
jgi:predicted DNA-binding transcriptional regulator AlpA